MYYVYVLCSRKTNKLYKGSTSDLKERINNHNRGHVASTKNGRPWQLIYCAGFLNKTDALCEERFLKSGKGRDRLRHLLQNTLL